MLSPLSLIGNAANFGLNEAASAQTQVNNARKTGENMVQEQLSTELHLQMTKHKGLENRSEAVLNRSKDTSDKCTQLMSQVAQPG